jgi:sulfate adenylyltransferase
MTTVPTPPLPQHCPSPRELDDLELLTSGALAPLDSFNQPGSPVTLALPAEVLDEATRAGAVELVDPEGLPLALVAVPGGQVEALAHAQFGPFRRLYLTPRETRERYAGRTFVPVADALTEGQLKELADTGPTVLLALVGTGTPDLSAVALLRATLAAAARLDDAVVVAVPLASHGDAEVDHELGVRVAINYAGGDPVRGLAIASDELAAAYPPEIAEIVAHDRPEPERQGLVLFFTGLSGSGKSTLARALMDRLLEQGSRTVTSLDGDVVRRNLSAGLTFSKGDRETNIRRIGWVAAEISRHGGVAVCSPIAPFDQTRQDVRSMVEAAGGAFFLVHVATPLEECERRDRKGLYAKARRGEIPEFTGISSPYEEPEDADVRVDTTGRTIDEALTDVLDALQEAGYLDLDPTPAEPQPSVVEPVETTDTLRVLFVCTANICRSPFMELAARDLAGPDARIVFSSAGTHGFRDRAMDEAMATTLTSRSLSSDTFVSRPLTAELIEEADLVLTAEAAQRTHILDDHPAAFRKVFTLGQFAESVRAADPSLAGRDLLAAVGQRRGSADPGLDVPDPYSRGPEAAAASAARIEDLLGVVIPALTGSRKITA